MTFQNMPDGNTAARHAYEAQQSREAAVEEAMEPGLAALDEAKAELAKIHDELEALAKTLHAEDVIDHEQLVHWNLDLEAVWHDYFGDHLSAFDAKYRERNDLPEAG